MEPVTTHRLRSRRKWILMIVCSGVFLFGLWAFVIEPNSLMVRETSITLPHWPTELKGLRIAVIADLHPGAPHITINKIRTLVDLTNSSRPDLILLCGDLVENALGLSPIDPETTASEIKGLKAQFGVFATLGNHDWWYNAPRVGSALEGVGIRVLENEAFKLERDGKEFWVVGLGDLMEGSPDLSQPLNQIKKDTAADAPIIVFTHNPDLFPQIPARVALTIAGHTHGGQVALPLIGRPIVPSRYGQRYAIGHIVEGGNNLFVTPGVGTSIIPIRFRTPPEISLLTIN